MADGDTPAWTMESFRPEASGPLTGLRVLDLTRLVAGNMLSLQLADFGADVIKIENITDGDTLRHWTQPSADDPDGFDGWWQVYARNKRSLALNLRERLATSLLCALCRTSHVFMESFRPGTLEAMGLGPDVLLEHNPKLIIVRLSGWGQTGPYRDFPGFGSLIEGFSGYAMKSGDHPEAPPELPGIALADMVTGLQGAFAVMAAIRAVEVNGGRGQVIDLSLLEPMLSIMGPDVTNYARTGHVPVRGVKIASPRGAYRCNDGQWVAMSGSTDAMARKVFLAIGCESLFETERFRTNAARLTHDAELDNLIADFIAGMDLPTCLAHFRRHGVTVGPIYDAVGLHNDEHVKERGAYVATAGADNTGNVVMHAVTPRLSETPGSLRRPAPKHGEHTYEILSSIGLKTAQVDELHERGVIKCC